MESYSKISFHFSFLGSVGKGDEGPDEQATDNTPTPPTPPSSKTKFRIPENWAQAPEFVPRAHASNWAEAPEFIPRNTAINLDEDPNDTLDSEFLPQSPLISQSSAYFGTQLPIPSKDKFRSPVGIDTYRSERLTTFV